MAYDLITFVTDDINDNLASYANEKRTALLHLMSAAAYAGYVRAQSMTGNVTLTDDDLPIQSFSPTAARDLTLPAVASTNHAFYVVNRSATYEITVKNAGGTVIIVMSPGMSEILFSDGANGWYVPGAESGSEGGVGKNVLPNGGMMVQQRGAGPFTSASSFPNNDAVYLVDGMVLLSDGNDVVDVSVVADNDFVSGLKLRFDVETANKRFLGMFPVQMRDIQDIRYAGMASLQFKVKCTGTSISNCRAYLLAWDSTADAITRDAISAWGSAGADPTFATNWTAENTGSNLAVGTTIVKYEIENIAVDTSGVNNLAVLIMIDDTDATAGDYFEIGDIKLEAGSACTEFEAEDYATTLLRCSRRFSYFTLGAGNVVGTGYSGGAGTSVAINMPLPAPMADSPSPTLISGAASTFTARANALSNAATAIALTTIRNNIAMLSLTVTASANHVAAVYANTTSYIGFSSEL